ncbi:MAG TPA: carboxypeptidase-like regulatory domain-containing protein, partial [Gemmatimonadaceae bacterium]
MTLPVQRWFQIAGMALAALAPVAVASAQNGTITGTVVEQAGRAPVPAAQVHIVGTTLGAQTNAEGKYTIRGIPAGEHEVRARRIGYQEATTAATVIADTIVVVDVALTAAEAVLLSQTIVTATGEQQRRE